MNLILNVRFIMNYKSSRSRDQMSRSQRDVGLTAKIR